MITLIIKNKNYKNTTYKYKTTLKREGFTYNDSKRQWEKNITKAIPASIKKDTREYKKKIKQNKNHEKKQIKITNFIVNKIFQTRFWHIILLRR